MAPIIVMDMLGIQEGKGIRLAQSALARKLILVIGKGGVGKTTFAQALSRDLASQGKKVLLCNVLQVAVQPQTLERRAENFWETSLDSKTCFEEYIQLKLKVKSLYKLFLGNKAIQYIERAAPGVRELVLTGKFWFERENYDHVVVDMPSTGYALTMLHTPKNFARLFPGGPVHTDAKEMDASFRSDKETSFVIVSLAEEMPAQESLELATKLAEVAPENKPFLVLNRLVLTSEKAKTLNRKLGAQAPALNYLVEKEKHQTEVLALFHKHKDRFVSPWISIEEATNETELTHPKFKETAWQEPRVVS